MINTSQITFVTAFFKIYNEPPVKNRTIDWRMTNFEKLAQTNIPLLIYTCSEYYSLLAPYLEKYPNLRIGRIMEFSDIVTWQKVEPLFLNFSTNKINNRLLLPENRCVTKDTPKYITLMNSKTEFLKYAIEENPWNSTHFSWIDFNIFHIIKNDNIYATELLRKMATYNFQTEDFVAVPGCWDRILIDDLTKQVCWRFCGGFFLGTSNAILDFHALYEKYFIEFLEKHGVLLWEVNFWSWLEAKKLFTPLWCKSDHNVGILELTADICCRELPYTKSVRYNYPNLGDFVPTSTAYFYDRLNDREMINTRFVNYTIQSNGSYNIRHPNRHLHTCNRMSLLDSNRIPLQFMEMKEEENLQNYGGNICGIEDLRLYRLDSDIDPSFVRFVASNKNYVPNLKIRIMKGVYDMEKAELRDIQLLHPPTDTYCEKNWIPLPSEPVYETEDDENNEYFISESHEYFIYRWMPFEIGSLDDTNQLHIVKKYNHFTPFWRDVRGSSCLQETDDGYLCVVHFSEEKYPRHYFHLLVLLEKRTYKPLKYSHFFCFHKKSIEFCIGFCKKEDVYCFWISNFDRDPEYLETPCSAIELCYDIAIL